MSRSWNSPPACVSVAALKLAAITSMQPQGIAMTNPLGLRQEMIDCIQHFRHSRRRFLAGAAVVGSGGLLTGLAQIDAFAQDAASANASKAIIPARSPLKIT